MTATKTMVMQSSKRGDVSKKQQLHLPIIAPKDDRSSSASSSKSLNSGTSNSAVHPRARLPPRSRTGCWTCRSRKVKCDEGRPCCGQCTRLGHNCDYNPRLSFRDDTPRVVERMQDVLTSGSAVWDPTSPDTTDTSIDSTVADKLPPFATLTTDEERERKAECTSPGTYNVVVNPESFHHLPEYYERDNKSWHLSPLRRGSLATSLDSSQGKDVYPVDSTSADVPGTDDPNVVILHRFEDTTRRQAIQWKSSRSPPSPQLCTIKAEPEEIDGIFSIDFGDSLIHHAASGGQDWDLLQQFRNVVWRQLTQVDSNGPGPVHSESSGAEILEHAAAFFPPLFHAMMAVAALSIAHQEGKERLVALQHYQQALPALHSNLRTADDLSSDGAFLTHFLLLVYEIAAAESGGSNLWSQHLARLLRISLLRREVFGGERFPFITWWICNIDLYALYSGAGTGDFVGTILKNDMIPPPSFHLYPLGSDGSSIIYSEETDTLPTILQLSYEVTILGVRLGLLAQEFRQESSHTSHNVEPILLNSKIRQSRVSELQDALRQLWTAPSIMGIGQKSETLPRRSRQIYDQASSLSRACLIYSHTSMWPSQRLDTGPIFDSEIALCVNEILFTAESIISAGRLELRFIVFPLFMAGFASTDGTRKMMALDLIRIMEKNSIGSNTTAARHALQIVYEQQTERFMQTGHSLDVTWTDVMFEQGLQVVNFGL